MKTLGYMIARVKARFAVNSADYKGTIRGPAEPEKCVDGDPCTCVADFFKGGGVVRPGMVIPHRSTCLKRQLGIMDAVTGLNRGVTMPDRIPASTYAQIEEMERRRLGRVECKKNGKFRSFRTAEGFADHLKNYHGAKDGDAVERVQ